MIQRWRELLTGGVTPGAVLGTLVCCALPITLVSLGAGGVMAALLGTAPWLVALSSHKGWVFLGAGVLLAANYWALYRSGGVACQPGGACHPSHPLGRWLRRVYWGSVVLFGVGFFAAYLSLPLVRLVASAG